MRGVVKPKATWLPSGEKLGPPSKSARNHAGTQSSPFRHILGFWSHCIRPMGALKPDCVCALQRKRPQNFPTVFNGTAISCDLQRNAAEFLYFAAKSGAVSLQFRLAGGAGSLALTVLCPNSLLTGNLTGESCNSGTLKSHFLSLSYTVQKRNKRSGISPSREFAGMYQGIRFSYQRCGQRSSLRRQNS